MPKIKMTKTELKAQRDALKQFTRFLPTLQLKKQQLQMEMRKCQELVRQNEAAEHKAKEQLAAWIALFGSEGTVEKLVDIIDLKEVETSIANIAGVKVPVFKAVRFETEPYNLFIEEAWLDDAIEAVKSIISIQAEHYTLQEQYRLLGHELRTTTQRVNLFEKVKIPECKENIRVIQIYLGDMDTAGVARSKIAKKKSQEAAA